MTNNPFIDADPWGVGGESDQFLPVGDHVCEILEADGEGTSSGGYPQIELRVGNDRGSIRDWVVITAATVGKVKQLVLAAGIDPPGGDDFNPSDLRITQKYVDRLVGRSVGVIVRDEPDYKDNTKMRTRVSGYVLAERVATSDVTPPAVLGEAEMRPVVPANDAIPF